MMQPISTYYKGNKFRSRLEARVAVLFDALGVKEWISEPEGFILSDGTYYLPDFKIKVNCRTTDEDGYVWVEVKGASNYNDISPEDKHKIELFEKPLIVIGNLDAEHTDDGLFSFRFVDGDWYPAWFSVHAGEVWICGADHDEYDNGKAFNYALAYAKQARFEHGEAPSVVPYKQPKQEKDLDTIFDLIQRTGNIISKIAKEAVVEPDKECVERHELYIELTAIKSIAITYGFDKKPSTFVWQYVKNVCIPWIEAIEDTFDDNDYVEMVRTAFKGDA